MGEREGMSTPTLGRGLTPAGWSAVQLLEAALRTCHLDDLVVAGNDEVPATMAEVLQPGRLAPLKEAPVVWQPSEDGRRRLLAGDAEGIHRGKRERPDLKRIVLDQGQRQVRRSVDDALEVIRSKPPRLDGYVPGTHRHDRLLTRSPTCWERHPGS